MSTTDPLTDSEIIALLGGTNNVARMLGIKPPSVSGWLETGIPEGRLRDLAGQIELRAPERFSRRQRWPTMCEFYWPEMAQARIGVAPAATENVAQT